ncbi:MAG: TlpA family protein disulfide reductase [Acidimicrobiia bacterium]|nr:TlpA family protein disulfide reductase [Acidimicrobiia bacterium]
MDDQTPKDAPSPASGDDTAPAPLPNRIGRLAVIVAGVVLVALGVNAVLSTTDDPVGESGSSETNAIGISPADMPRGALAGEPAPPISLEMFDGQRFDLAGHVASDGRPIVLNFWASWCFPCRTEMPEFDEVAKSRPDVQFIGIAIEDSLGPALEFANEIQVSYPLGIDDSGDIAAAYPHIGLPTTYFINADGTVARQIQGQVTGELLQALVDFDFG